MRAYEYRGRPLDPRQRGGGLAHQELEVLGRQLVGESERLVQRGGHHRGAANAQRLCRDAIRAIAQLGLELRLDGERQRSLRRDQDRQRERIVLRLRDQVGRDQPCVGGDVGHHDHFGRPSERVDPHLPG